MQLYKEASERHGLFMLEILKSKWNEILDYIKHEYDISDVSFETWLVPLELCSIKDNMIYIIVEENIGVAYMNKRFSKYFKVTIAEFLGEPYEICFISREEAKNQSNHKKIEPSLNMKSENPALNSRILEANLNPRYTFETFVVGGSNNFAQAYALKVAEAPG